MLLNKSHKRLHGLTLCEIIRVENHSSVPRGAARDFGPHHHRPHQPCAIAVTTHLQNPIHPFKALNNSTFTGLQLSCCPILTVQYLLTVSCDNITLCRHACNILHTVELTIWCKTDTLYKKCAKGHLLRCLNVILNGTFLNGKFSFNINH